ncbi:hypothetical protein [Micromonospora sp. NPDC004551]|uniref:hypothetical protein n=1 Tax=Micromonospora sp. NPDC004551 TaxID=3154284 RepID=UPI0033B769EB
MPTGWCPGDRAITEMLDLYPGSTAVRVFFGPGEGLPPAAWTDPAWNPRQRLSALPASCTVVVSHKDQQVDAAAFADAWLVARPDVRLVLVAHHEPEQGKGGDPTPAQFRASWTRQRQQVGGHPARADGRLRLAVCYTLQWIRGGGNWRTWWPEHEAAAVDLVLFDWYQYDPTGRNPFRPVRYEPPASAIAPMTAIAGEVGKPWGIAEIDHLRITVGNGFTADVDPDGTGCAAWYRQMYAAARRLGCQVWCHFHRGHGDLTSRRPEQQALRDLITQEATDVGAQRRLDWIRRGSPFRLMTPAAALRDVLRRHGYTVYDIGNEDHLEHDPPEDHTPYSATGYPGKAQYGIGYAEDIMPPKDGQRSKVDGLPLPSLQQLGARLLADRKAGVPGIRWLKYMNWEPREDNGGPCYHESWQPDYARRTSTDRGHIHLSGLTGYESSTIGAGYDPVARIRGEDDHMDRAEFLGHFKAALADPGTAPLLKALPWQYNGRGLADNDLAPEGNISTLGALSETLLTVRAIAGKVDIDPAELEQIRAAAREGAASAADALVAAVLAKLPPGTLTRADVEAAVRDAFAGGLAPDAG